MTALRNATHLAVLAVWAVMGLLFTAECLFSGGPFLTPVLSFWLWLAAFGGLTTWLVTRFENAVGALAVHGLCFFALHLVPKTYPLSLLRLGLDLLAG